MSTFSLEVGKQYKLVQPFYCTDCQKAQLEFLVIKTELGRDKDVAFVRFYPCHHVNHIFLWETKQKGAHLFEPEISVSPMAPKGPSVEDVERLILAYSGDGA